LNSRRKFVTLGAASAFLGMLYPVLQSSKKLNKVSQLDFRNKVNDKNYIQINMYGAPTRWNFDSLLDPQGKGVIHDPSVGTSFKDDLGNLQFKQKKHGKYYLPELWDSSVAGLAVDQKLSSLLPNMIFMRGVDPKTVGHPQSSVKTVRANMRGQSLHGLNSNSSSSPLPSVLMGNNPATRAFRGDNRSAIHLSLTSKNLFKDLFKIFHNSSSVETSEVQGIIKKLKKKDPSYFKNMQTSTELFFDEIDVFNDEYMRLFNKYTYLVSRTLHDIPIEGVNDFKQAGLKKKDFSKLSAPLDKFGRFALDSQHIAFGDDLREMFKTSNLGSLPHQFALTEFLITRRLSNSFLLTTPNEIGRLLYNVDNRSNASLSSFSNGFYKSSNSPFLDISMDTHQTGSTINLYLTSMFFKGLGSCLVELVSALKRENIFDQTLIHLTSEFDRVPENNLAGSSHNDRAHSSSFISGKIRETSVIGNTFLGNKRLGSIGTCAPLKSLGRSLTQDDMTETLSNLLEIPSPVRRSVSLIKDSPSGWVSTLPEAKNIEGASS
jgi:hypothetical protein